MRPLAAFIMRGPWQAALSSGLLIAVALFMPLLSLLAAAAFGLVTLREGALRGVQVGFGAALVAALAGLLAGAPPTTVALSAAVVWAPVWALSLVLRKTRSLELALTAALGFAAALALAFFLALDDPQAAWMRVLKPIADALTEADMINAAQGEQLFALLAQWMGGILAAGLFLQVTLSLLLARWWQALLYNPGGFRQEFHALRLPKLLAGVSFALMVLTMLRGGEGVTVLDHLTLVFLSGFFIQGLALVHGAVGLLKASVGWLAGLYVLLLLALPQMITVLATAGLVDAMADLRARLARGREPPPDGD